MQSAAPGIHVLLVGCIIAGLATGILSTTVPVYIVELAHEEDQGRLVGVYGLMFAVGACLAN